MKAFKTIAVILMLVGIFSAAMYQLNNRAESIAAANTSDSAKEYDRRLSERLLRFGEMSFERGDILEARHFYKEAIIADPTHKTAWKKYNIAFLALISVKVENDPEFLPDYGTDLETEPSENDSAPVSANTAVEDEDDGC